jgi:hypothetical protein
MHPLGVATTKNSLAADLVFEHPAPNTASTVHDPAPVGTGVVTFIVSMPVAFLLIV